MSLAAEYRPHYTVEDYRQWEGDWELWSGTAVAMTPSPFGPHERVTSRLVQMLRNQIDEQQCDCEVYAGLDWIVSDDTVVRPDVMVVCGPQPTEHLHDAPSLVVEVLSPSTEGKDRKQKYELYREQGVRFYILADPLVDALDGNELVGDHYQKINSLADYQCVMHDDCEFRLDRQRLFR